MDGLAQDYSNSIADALELLQSCDKLWIGNVNASIGYQMSLIVIIVM